MTTIIIIVIIIIIIIIIILSLRITPLRLYIIIDNDFTDCMKNK